MEDAEKNQLLGVDLAITGLKDIMGEELAQSRVVVC